MHRLLLYLFFPAIFSFFWPGSPVPAPKKLLLIYSAPPADRALLAERINALKQLAAANNFTLDTTQPGRTFAERKSGKYDALVFINPAAEVLNFRQRSELERYVQAGGGFLQITPPPAAVFDWPWYTKLQEAGLKAQYVKSFQVNDKTQLRHWRTAFDGGVYSQLTLTDEKQPFSDSELAAALPAGNENRARQARRLRD